MRACVCIRPCCCLGGGAFLRHIVRPQMVQLLAARVWPRIRKQKLFLRKKVLENNFLDSKYFIEGVRTACDRFDANIVWFCTGITVETFTPLRRA